ncbi:MAG: hypothetical protein E7588_08380 [Ruminococcaceae bacterium]|nr:hypothetical protein [Oscillospiraceae bacterium]
MEKIQSIINSSADALTPVVLWHWNGAVSREGLLRQLVRMKKAGVGGCIAVYNPADNAEITREELCDLVFVCSDECQKLNMDFGILDTPDGHLLSAVHSLTDRAVAVYDNNNQDGFISISLTENENDIEYALSRFTSWSSGRSRFVSGCNIPESDENVLELAKHAFDMAIVRGACRVAYPVPYSPNGNITTALSPVQPYYDSCEKLNGYISRLSALMNEGCDTADILLIIDKADNKDAVNLYNLLSKLHIDFHVAEACAIKDSIKYKKPDVCIDATKYSDIFVIDSQKEHFPSAVLQALDEFEANGGKMVCFGENVPLEYESILSHMYREKLKNVKILSRTGNGDEILYRCRNHDGLKVYFFVNTAPYHVESKIYINGENSAVRLKAENMTNIRLLDIDYPQGVAFKLNFEPYQSHIVLVAHEGTLPEGIKADKPATHVRLKNDWEIEECEINALVLDTCRIKTGSELSDEMEISHAVKVSEGEFELHFDFEIDEAMSLKSCENLRLVIHNAMDHHISVNGRRVFYNGYSWWRDSSLEVIDIKDFVSKGHNDITLRGTKPFEKIYLIGNFGVYSRSGYLRTARNTVITDGPFVISNPPSQVPDGLLADAGMPFFTGRILLKQNLKIKKSFGERIYLDFNMPKAAMCRLYINSVAAFDVPWRDSPLDITSLVKRGINTLKMELIISDNNLTNPRKNGISNRYRLNDTGI